MKKLLRNAIQTPDGTVLQSHSRHDYKVYQDANGKEYMVDGGLEYERGSANGDELPMYIYDDAPHSVARGVVTWGTYGKEGNESLHYKTVADMETGHLEAVLTTQSHIYPQVKKVMLDELTERGVDFDGSVAEQARAKVEKKLIENLFESLTNLKEVK